MKKIKAFILASTLAIAATSGYSQTETNLPPFPETGVFENVLVKLTSITNWSVHPYMTIANDAPTKYGGGVLAIYNVNQFIGAGIGVDWLGRFNMLNGNVSLRATYQPFKSVGIDVLKGLSFTPWAMGAVATPFGGAGDDNGGFSPVVGAGIQLGLYERNGWKFGVGYGYTHWSNAGRFSGWHNQIFASVSKGY